MNLLLIGPVYPYRGGIAHTTALMCRALTKSNRVKVISFSRQYPRWLYPGRSDKDPSQEPLRVDAEYLLDPMYFWTWWRTARSIVKLKPSAVILTWWTTFWAPAFSVLAYFLRKQKVPLVILAHNVLPHEPRFFDRSLTRLVLKQANLVILLSEREKSRLLELIPGASAEVIHLPIIEMSSGQKLQKDTAREKLSLRKDLPLALFFGIVRPYKGLKYLIEAVGWLHRTGKDVALVVAGEIWGDKRRYEELVEEHNLQDLVRLEDRYIPDEELEAYFSSADVLVAPYIDGSQSAAVKLAMSYHLPIVTSDILAEEGPADPAVDVLVSVPPGDATALAQAIDELISHPNALPGFQENKPSPIDWDEFSRRLCEAVNNIPAAQ